MSLFAAGNTLCQSPIRETKHFYRELFNLVTPLVASLWDLATTPASNKIKCGNSHITLVGRKRTSSSQRCLVTLDQIRCKLGSLTFLKRRAWHHIFKSFEMRASISVYKMLSVTLLHIIQRTVIVKNSIYGWYQKDYLVLFLCKVAGAQNFHSWDRLV